MLNTNTRNIIKNLSVNFLVNLLAGLVLAAGLAIPGYHYIVRHRDVVVQLAPEKLTTHDSVSAVPALSFSENLTTNATVGVTVQRP
jgi:hypothetical protein